MKRQSWFGRNIDRIVFATGITVMGGGFAYGSTAQSGWEACEGSISTSRAMHKARDIAYDTVKRTEREREFSQLFATCADTASPAACVRNLLPGAGMLAPLVDGNTDAYSIVKVLKQEAAEARQAANACLRDAQLETEHRQQDGVGIMAAGFVLAISGMLATRWKKVGKRKDVAEPSSFRAQHAPGQPQKTQDGQHSLH